MQGLSFDAKEDKDLPPFTKLVRDVERMGIHKDHLACDEKKKVIAVKNSTPGKRISLKISHLMSQLGSLVVNESGLLLEFDEATVTLLENYQGHGTQKKRSPYEVVFDFKGKGMFITRDASFSKDQEVKKQSSISDFISGLRISFEHVRFQAESLTRTIECNSSEIETQVVFTNFELTYQRTMESFLDTRISLEMKSSKLSVIGDVVSAFSEINKDLNDVTSFKLFTDKRNSIGLSSFASSFGISIPSFALIMEIAEVHISSNLQNLNFKLNKSRYNIDYFLEKTGNYELKQIFYCQKIEATVDGSPVLAIDSLAIQQNVKENSIEAKIVTLNPIKISQYNNGQYSATRSSRLYSQDTNWPLLFALSTLSNELFYCLLEKYKVNIYRLSLMQPSHPNLLLVFTDLTMPKKDTFQFDTMEVYDDSRGSSSFDDSGYYHFKNLPLDPKKRLATSITEVQDDVKKFELKPRTSSLQ